MKTLKRIALMLAVGALPLMVYAEDIDIYMDPSPPLGGEPLVMFTLDYRPNLGSNFNLNASQRAFFEAELGFDPGGSQTYFSVLRLALRVVFKDLSGVKIGLLLPHNFSNNCQGPANSKANCANGGYIAMGFQSVDRLDSNGAKARFMNILENMPTPSGGLSHSWQGKEMWFEFFRYLTGQEVYNGRNGFRSYSGATGSNNSQNLDVNFPAIAWDSDIMAFDRIQGSGSNAHEIWRYTSPLDAATECTRIFTINFAFGVSNQDSNSDAAIGASPANGGLGINMSGQQGSFTNVLKFLYDSDLGNGQFGTVPDLSGKQNIMGWLLTNQDNPNRDQIADAMGTRNALNVLNDPELLVETLRSIFQQILSVSTTFVAASVPVNVFNRSEIVDNVYIALFQADADRRPSWPGSLKKLKIEQDGNVVRLIDFNGIDAVAADGRINFNALSFWTNPDTLPPPDPNENELAGRDGRSVARGGAGQRIPGFVGTVGPGLVNGAAGARILFTEPDTVVNGIPTLMRPLNADATTATVLQGAIGAPSVVEAERMLRWMRGRDEYNPDTTVRHLARTWLLGDPLHSRPLPINYGARPGFSSQNPDIRIAIGSNDGYLRMIQNTGPAVDPELAEERGVESWAFMPRAVMDKMPILKDDLPLPAGTPPHPYTVDGAPVVYVDDVNANGTIEVGDTVIVYTGLRRGGRAYYAIDASNPDVPRMRWRITSADPNFAELGLSYSTPQVGRVLLGTTPTPVVIFTGGYDTNKDQRLAGAGTNDSQGRAIFVVNALTGALIWKVRNGASTGPVSASMFQHAGMVDSFPSDPTAVDTSGDGFIDRIYVGDSGGTVWRVDMHGNNPAAWHAAPLAYLGRHYVSDDVNDRRFFHAPDVVLSRDDIGAFDAVIIGSGNRENPLDRGPGDTTDNFFYMIKDRRVISGPMPDPVPVAYNHTSFGDVTNNCLQLNTCDGADPNLTNGWRLRLEETTGEKSLAVPFTIAGTVFFTTYLPPGSIEAATCGPAEGGGVLYAVALADARSVINFDTTDDDPDNPGQPTTRSDRTRALRSGGIPAEVVSLPPNRILLPDLSTEAIPGSMRWRTFWYESERPDT